MIRYIRDGNKVREIAVSGEFSIVTAEALRLIGLIYNQLYAQDRELAARFKLLVTASILSPASGVFEVFDSNT